MKKFSERLIPKMNFLVLAVFCLISLKLYCTAESGDFISYENLPYKVTAREKISSGYKITINNELTFELKIIDDEPSFPKINFYPVIWIEPAPSRKGMYKLLTESKVYEGEIQPLKVGEIYPSFNLQGEEFFDVKLKGGLTLRYIKKSRKINEIIPVDSDGRVLFEVGDSLKRSIFKYLKGGRFLQKKSSSRKEQSSVVVTEIFKVSDNRIKVTFNNVLTINEVILKRGRITWPKIDGKPIIKFKKSGLKRKITRQISKNKVIKKGFKDLEVTNLSIEPIRGKSLKGKITVHFNNAFELREIPLFKMKGKYSISGPSIMRDGKRVKLGKFTYTYIQKIMNAIMKELKK